MAEENEAEGATEGAADDAVKKKDGAGGGAAPAGGSNQKFVMIVLMLNTVVLIIVAVLAVISIKKQSQEVSLADVAAGDKTEHAVSGGEHGAAGGDSAKKNGDPAENNFIKESFTVNLADSQGAHYAQVVIEIEVPDESVKKAVEALRPKIRDFIVVVLSSKTYEQVSSVDGREFLREEIRNKINGHLTRGQISEVHFTQFIVQ